MIVRFAEFEFSLETLKLRRDGALVRLVGQPLHLLVMLLERPGVVVSREEIRQKLWPDTHVDFDHSVHSALNRLRAALGDSGKQPRFIETIPTIGYRFLAPVEAVTPARAAAAQVSPPARIARRAMWFLLTAIAAAVLALVIVRRRYDSFVPRGARNR